MHHICIYYHLVFFIFKIIQIYNQQFFIFYIFYIIFYKKLHIIQNYIHNDIGDTVSNMILNNVRLNKNFICIINYTTYVKTI